MNENKENELKGSVPENKNSKESTKLSLSSAIIVAGLIVAAGLFFGLNSKGGNKNVGLNTDAQPNQPSAQPSAQPDSQTVDIAKVKTAGEPFIGNPNAPVTIAFWSDYQCPFCKHFDNDTIKQVVDNYVKQGKVKIVFKDFQFLGNDSQVAGIIGRAVWEVAPDKYYSWHEAMYKNQDKENSGWGNKSDILALTQSLGIDSKKVETLATKNVKKYINMINADRSEGSSFGINGTPGTIIGKNLISGAQPYSSVKQLIDAELQNK